MNVDTKILEKLVDALRHPRTSTSGSAGGNYDNIILHYDWDDEAPDAEELADALESALSLVTQGPRR